MPEVADPQLSGWGNFYVIVGSAGAALIGVQFVVMTLVASLRSTAPADTVGAFSTPTVAHFSNALLVSAIMSAPWPSLLPVSFVLGVCGVGGLIYSAVVIRRTRRQTGYQPVWQDWVWYAILPCTLYAVLALAACYLRTAAGFDLFLIAAATLGLLLVGVHNAWDSVTHIVISNSRKNDKGKQQAEP